MQLLISRDIELRKKGGKMKVRVVGLSIIQCQLVTKSTVAFLLVIFFHLGILHAADLRVRAVDPHGDGIADAAITVRSLATTEPGKVQELVTSALGWTRLLKLPSGLYQISVADRGYMTSVRELFIDNSTHEIEIRMRPGSIIDLAATNENSAKQSWHIALRFRFNDRKGEPIIGARILLRDSEGNNQQWVQTDSAGRITVEVQDPPLSLVPGHVVVLPIQGIVYTFLLLNDDCSLSPELQSDFMPQGAKCVAVKDLSAEIDIPGPNGE